MSSDKKTNGTLSPGDRVWDPMNQRRRTVSQIQDTTVFMEDGGVMGLDECTDVLLPGEPDPPEQPYDQDKTLFRLVVEDIQHIALNSHGRALTNSEIDEVESLMGKVFEWSATVEIIIKELDTVQQETITGADVCSHYHPDESMTFDTPPALAGTVGGLNFFIDPHHGNEVPLLIATHNGYLYSDYRELPALDTILKTRRPV